MTPHHPALRIVTALAAAFIAAGSGAAGAAEKPMNSLMTIRPYWHNGTWVFDDPARGLHAEPFVAGVPEMIDRLLAQAGKPARAPFTVIFGARPFPGAQATLVWVREDMGGNWYRWNGAEGWLCPALFKYFAAAPKHIYLQIR